MPAGAGAAQEAIDKGWFRTQRSQLEGGVNMAAVLATAAQVAAGMAFLHARAVVHGDLTGGAPLLTSRHPHTCFQAAHQAIVVAKHASLAVRDMLSEVAAVSPVRARELVRHACWGLHA